jgi:hypothetical protein
MLRPTRPGRSQAAKVIAGGPVPVRARGQGVVRNRPDQLVAVDHDGVLDVRVAGTRLCRFRLSEAVLVPAWKRTRQVSSQGALIILKASPTLYQLYGQCSISQRD